MLSIIVLSIVSNGNISLLYERLYKIISFTKLNKNRLCFTLLKIKSKCDF